MADIHHRMNELQKSTQVTIPDLYALLPGWEFAVNPHYDAVKRKVDDMIVQLMPGSNDSTRLAVKAGDYTLMTGCFCPYANKQECFIMAFYHLWIFIWDDEIDCGSLTDDPVKIQSYRDETLSCINFALGPIPFSGPRPSLSPFMLYFLDIAREVVKGTTQEARTRVLDELTVYVGAVCALSIQRRETLHDLLLDERLFVEQRANTGGCGVSVALLLYVYHLDIPSSIYTHEAIVTITKQACAIVHLVNDIVSFVKEMRINQYDSIVAILALKYDITLQEAVERACTLVVEAREKLEAAETRLPIPTGNPELDKQVKQYVKGCRDIAAGNLHWSYMSDRYFGKDPERDGNKITLYI